MADLTNKQKKEWARSLYLHESLTQQEIADRVGVSRVTVSRWFRDEKWEEHKVGITLTRREQVQSFYRQVGEINKAIQTKPEGQRYPDAKQADTLVKLTAAIHNMEQEVGIAERIAVLTDVIEWLRKADLDKAKELATVFDSYIKDKL